ncbi:MAG: glycosyl transferase, partial [Chitinophagaceae bacterium]
MMDSSQLTGPYRWLKLLLSLAVFANFAPLFVTVLGPDGTLYAAISKTMAIENDYVNLMWEGRDWLDKPHFPFWVTALFFEMFGVHGWSYKLPGILFLLMGAWYTYRLGFKLYSKQTGLVAALILLTAEHILLSSNDVRAEPYLTGLLVAAVFHFVCLNERFRFMDLLLGSLFTACAVMSKGVFAIIPIGGAIIGHQVMVGQWRQIFQPRWFAAIVLTFLFITPELYTLWVQFDTQPEKVVFGQTGVSGIRFFFWDSQFGRFFNTGPIKGKGDLSFFIHTTLWAFLPWSMLLFIAIGRRFSKFRQKGLEWYSLFAAMLAFFLFSLSRFQLPHYLNIVFPFFAILTAEYLLELKLPASLRKIFTLQTVLVILLFVGGFLLQMFYEPPRWGWLVLAGGVLAVIILLPANRDLLLQRIVTLSSTGIIAINLYLFWILYPDLLRYQSGSEIAFVANERYPGVPVVAYKLSSSPLEFYLDESPVRIDTLAALNSLPRPLLLITPNIAAKDTTVPGPVHIFPDFRIS